MERAMSIAREIQLGLLPKSAPSVRGFDLAGFSQPADQTGGDIYDFVPLPNERWGLVVADATGHGIGPALIIAETRAMLRAIGRQGAALPDILQTANALLSQDLGQGRFVTCFFGILDGREGSLTYASAGHGPLLFYNRRSDSFDEAAATSLPLGVLEDSDYGQVVRRPFAPGDVGLIMTDGVFEAVNPAGEQFGIRRVMEVVRCQPDATAQAIIRNVHATVLNFTGAQPQTDDLTAIVIKRTD